VDARRRFRPVDRPLFVHVYIHLDMGFLAYWPEGSPLSTPVGYWSFIKYLTLNLEYSVIQLAGIAIMDTHVHLLLVLMPGKLSLREVARRYNRRYRNDRTRKELNIRDHRAQLKEERKKMQDMSNFTQRLFSAWAGDMADRTRDKLGRQALHVRVCGDRHRESVPVSAVVAKIFALYVDRNPSRAGLPASPPDRPRSTWEFLRHPKLRHLLNGFSTWIGMAFDRVHECARVTAPYPLSPATPTAVPTSPAAAPSATPATSASCSRPALPPTSPVSAWSMPLTAAAWSPCAPSAAASAEPRLMRPRTRRNPPRC
jgi:hypothetical protein